MVFDPRRLLARAGVTALTALVLGCTSTGSAPSATPPSAAPASSASASEAASSGAVSGGTTVSATESEYKVDLSATSAPAGDVTFQIKNAGTIQHEFVVVKTDLAADKLPIGEGEVDEDDGQLQAVDEIEDIDAGGSPTLSVNLPAGHYVVFCNIAGHYQLGMRTDFTTSG